MSTQNVATSCRDHGTVLVTGGTGLVGSHSIARLITEGYRGPGDTAGAGTATADPRRAPADWGRTRPTGWSSPSISLFGMAQILREHVSAAAAGLPAKEMTIEQVREAARTEPALRDAAAL